MSKISIYEVVPVPKLADKLVGTSVGGDPEDITYNFTLSELLNLFIPNIPGNTLQGVLDFGNTATQNINLTGIITTTTLNVGSTANILNSNLTGQTKITGGLYDRLNSIGTAGQVLTSTGTQVEWYTIPTVIPDLQQVLTSGNTAVNNIILTGNLSANNAALLTSTISTSLTVLGTLRDGLSSVGANNQVLSSNVSGVRWVNLPVYSATSPLLYNSGTGVFSIQQANASQNGYLSSADWITFDGKQTAISLTTTGNSGASTLVGATINVPNYTLSGLGGVPQTRTLTINGVTYNLSADRSWTLATGVSSVSATTPLFSTGGVNPDISIQQADSVLNGYLSSTDWLMFNDKQPAGNYITSLTGEATGAGPGATAVTLSTTAVTGKLLTGLNLAAGGTISATDSILIAFGKTQNQISALLGGVIFKGVWNANTNTPTLVSSVGTQGWYYIVNVAGTTNLNGITDWQVGDWAIFNGTVWDKVDNTDAVSSVNGFTGAVSLTTDNIPEGSTNLYYTNTRARAALSFAAGSGAYNNTTGVITIPTNNNQITNGSNYITLASLSAVSPLSYINTTGVFSIQVANTSQDGYLSSIDWNTFNNKQATITLTTTGTSGAATLVGATLNIPQYQSVLTNPITGTGTSGQVAYFNGTNSITSGSSFAFTPTSQLLVNNSVTAASAIARGTNLTPTLVAAANSDVLVGLDINPTFTNGAFTGVVNYALRTVASNIAVTHSGANNKGFYIIDNTNNSVIRAGIIYDGTNAFTDILGRYNNGPAFLRQDGGNGNILFLRNSVEYQRIFGATGNVTIQGGGTFTDAGFRLDVAGTARVQGALTSIIGASTSNTYLNTIDITQTGNIAPGNAPTMGLNITGTYTDINTANNTIYNPFLNVNPTINFNAVGLNGVARSSMNLSPVYFCNTARDINNGLTILNIRPSFTARHVNDITGILYNPTFTLSGANNNHRAIQTVTGDVLLCTTSGSVAIGTSTLGTATKLTLGGSQTASSAIARGQLLNTTLVAAANNNSLIGLDIAPTYTNGAFTGVGNIGLRIAGDMVFTGANTIWFNGYYFGAYIYSDGYSITNNLRSLGNSHRVIYGNASVQTTITGLTDWTIAFRGDNGSTGISTNITLQNVSTTFGKWFSSGNWFIGTSPTDAGYKLDVNGTARVQGDLTVTGSVSISTGTNSLLLGGLTTLGYTGATLEIGRSASWSGINLYASNVAKINLTSTLSTFTNTTINFATLNLQFAGIDFATDMGSRVLGLFNTKTATTYWDKLDFYTRDVAGTSVISLYRQTANGIKIGANTDPLASAILDVQSTTKGFLPPRMTSAQRTAIASPATGLIVYQTDGVEGLWLNTSTGWRELTVV